ncbi:MAG: hypothetical protein ACLT0W_05785 [Clostridium sp.]
MVLVKKGRSFSHLGVSVAGGVSHNIGQLLVAIPVPIPLGFCIIMHKLLWFPV